MINHQSFILEIGGNGVGYIGDWQTQKYSSLGLRLIQQLVVQINGRIEKVAAKKGIYYRLIFREIESV